MPIGAPRLYAICMIERSHYGDTDFVTGMRAWAAMGVVLIHSGGAGLRSLGHLGNAIVDFGSAGVYAFFVISGFSVCHSVGNSAGYSDYVIRRLSRILPVYYIFILMIGVINGASLENLVMHLLMISWLDKEIANSILGVEWSIPVEVFWYLLLPPMFAFARRGWRHLAALVGACFLSYWVAFAVARIAGIHLLALHWSPFRYAFLFSLGIAAFMIRDARRQMPQWASDGAILAAVCLIGSHLVRPLVEPYFVAGLATAVIIAFGRGSSSLVRLLFLSAPCLWIGAISYSLYLAHAPVFGALRPVMEYGSLPFFAVGTALAAGLALASYTFIERPSIALGRALQKRRAAGA